jgi:hypothetical protein
VKRHREVRVGSEHDGVGADSSGWPEKAEAVLAFDGPAKKTAKKAAAKKATPKKK